jgi:hypothetical protein
MPYHIGLEDIEPDHWVAWVFTLPGCFAASTTADAATACVPAAIAARLDHLSTRGRARERDADVTISVVDTFHSFISTGDYVVNAFFADDRRPIALDEVDDALWVLDESRHDLLATVGRLSPMQRSEPIAGEARGSIDGILEHIAWTEWWYFDRLGLAFAREMMATDPVAKLEQVREQTQAHLPVLVRKDCVVELSGEQWSARKVLRRTLWHERDHVNHLARLIGGEG